MALAADEASTWRKSATVERDESTSTTLRPILAAARSVTCFSAESGNQSASTSPLAKPCSSRALACASTKPLTSDAVHLRFLPVYRTASRIGSSATAPSNCLTSVDAARTPRPAAATVTAFLPIARAPARTAAARITCILTRPQAGPVALAPTLYFRLGPLFCHSAMPARHPGKSHFPALYSIIHHP